MESGYAEESDDTAESLRAIILNQPLTAIADQTVRTYMKKDQGAYVYGIRLKIKEYSAVGGNESLYLLGDQQNVLTRDLGKSTIVKSTEILGVFAEVQKTKNIQPFLNYLYAHYDRQETTNFINNVLKKTNQITLTKNTWLIDSQGKIFNYSKTSYLHTLVCASSPCVAP